MKKIIAIVLSLVFVFAVTSVTFAASAKKAKPVQATGEVTAVDATANTITLKAKNGDVTVATDDKTKVMPKDKKIADVKVGDKVMVTYTNTDGKNTAKSVTIKPAPKKTEKAVKKEAAPAKQEVPAAAAPAKKSAGY